MLPTSEGVRNIPRYWNVVPEQSGAVFFCSEQKVRFSRMRDEQQPADKREHGQRRKERKHSTRQLHGRQYSFTPTHKLLLMTNYKPHADARDQAFWSRACLLEFGMRFVARPKAPDERWPTPPSRRNSDRSAAASWPGWCGAALPFRSWDWPFPSRSLWLLRSTATRRTASRNFLMSVVFYGQKQPSRQVSSMRLTRPGARRTSLVVV